MGYPQALEHLIVVTLENRSFDQMVGALATDAGWLAGHPGERVDGLARTYHNRDLDGGDHPSAPFPPEHPRKHVWTPDAPHGADMVRIQIETAQSDGTPTMGGFVQAFEQRHRGVAAPGDIMRHFTRADLPVSYHLADHFAVCDRWFAAVAGDTFPNRMYAIAGDCAGIETTAFNRRFLLGANLTTIFEEMTRFGDSWAMYSGVLPMALALPRVRRLCHYTHGSSRGGSRWLSQFATDVANHRLPRLSWLEPTYYWHGSGLPARLPVDPLFPQPCCDHPPSDVARGQALLAWVYEALRQHPEVWARSALVVTYDEHGGFFDHVEPPSIHDEVERNRRLDGGFTDHFTRRGPRVPAFIAAPWVRSRVVHDRFDHCSVLKFLCEWLGIPPWTDRIASPRISSLEVAFEGRVVVQVPPAAPAPPPPATDPVPLAPPVEPDLSGWLPEIQGAMTREAPAPGGEVKLAAPADLVSELAAVSADRSEELAAAATLPVTHLFTDDVDDEVRAQVERGGALVGDQQVDGRRVVTVVCADQSRVSIWTR